MKVYLDVFFLVNVGMNFSVLLLESFWERRNVRIRRMLSAAAFGAVMACLMVFLGIHRNIPVFVLCYLLISAIQIRLGFGKTTPGAFLRNLVMYYVMSFILAGMLTQMENIFSASLGGIQMLTVIIIFLLLVRFLIPGIHKRQEKSCCYYRVCIYYKDRKIAGNAFLDTGNGLYEPISQKPVLLGEEAFVQKLWQGREKPLMRMIPFHSIGKESGILPAFQAEMLEIQKKGNRERVEKPWVAVCNKYVSVDGEYEIILHPDMFIKEKKKEEH